MPGPLLTVSAILEAADAHRAQDGRLPTVRSARVALPAGAASWKQVDRALREGWKGLPGGSSLARLLEKHRGYVEPARRQRAAVEAFFADGQGNAWSTQAIAGQLGTSRRLVRQVRQQLGGPANPERRIAFRAGRPIGLVYAASMGASRREAWSYWIGEAASLGVAAQDLRQLAREVATAGQCSEDLASMLRDARRMLLAMGWKLPSRRRLEGEGADADAIRGLDVVAAEMVARYPALFAGRGDAEAYLFELLAQGPPEPAREGDALRVAVDLLAARGPLAMAS